MQSFKKISAILMSFVVLFSTMSFTISEHYCGEHLVDIALFSKAEACGMDMEKPTANNDCSVDEKDCCSDVLQQIEGQQVINVNYTDITPDQQLFIVSFAYSYLNLFEGLDKNVVPFKDYSPPLIITDIHVLDQVFLI